MSLFEKRPKPLFQELYENIQENGQLDPNYHLDTKTITIKDNQTIRMGEGTMDGIHIYHMHHQEVTEEEKQEILKTFQILEKGKYKKSEKALTELAQKHTVIHIIDALIPTLFDNENILKINTILDEAIKILALSRNIEAIKIALVITEIIAEPDEDIKTLIKTFSLNSEFTLYTLHHILSWENGNQQVYELAKNLDGWGKVHAITKLSPTTQEIKDWLLYEALDEQTLSDYTAIDCYYKSEIPQRLTKKITNEEYYAINKTIHRLTMCEAAIGIEGIENEDITNFITKTKEHEITEEVKQTLTVLKEFLENTDQQHLAKQCEEILSTN